MPISILKHQLKADDQDAKECVCVRNRCRAVQRGTGKDLSPEQTFFFFSSKVVFRMNDLLSNKRLAISLSPRSQDTITACGVKTEKIFIHFFKSKVCFLTVLKPTPGCNLQFSLMGFTPECERVPNSSDGTRCSDCTLS